MMIVGMMLLRHWVRPNPAYQHGARRPIHTPGAERRAAGMKEPTKENQ